MNKIVRFSLIISLLFTAGLKTAQSMVEPLKANPIYSKGRLLLPPMAQQQPSMRPSMRRVARFGQVTNFQAPEVANLAPNTDASRQPMDVVSTGDMAPNERPMDLDRTVQAVHGEAPMDMDRTPERVHTGYYGRLSQYPQDAEMHVLEG